MEADALYGTAVTSYQYDALNRLMHVNGTPLLWDDAGNLLPDQDGTRYTYNVTGRMAQVQQSGNTRSSHPVTRMPTLPFSAVLAPCP